MVELPDPAKKTDVARFFAVSDETVRKWMRAGKLPYFRTPGGQIRFSREVVVAFKEGRK